MARQQYSREELVACAYVTTEDGTEIFFKDWGEGQPIVFHHGWPLSSDDWEAQMMFFLQHGYRVIAHDRRGHGRSGQVSGGHDMDTYAKDAAVVVDHLDLHDAIHVGHSTGGGEVARYVAEYGKGRVAKAALISSVPPLMLKTDSNPGGLPIEVFDSFREGTGFNRAQFFLDVASGPFYGFNRPGAVISEGIIRNWWRQGMMGSAKAHYEGIKAFSETDQTEDLKAIEVPTLVLHGDDDQVVPIADSIAAHHQAAEERHAEGVSGLSTRHVYDPCGRHQSGPARVRKILRHSAQIADERNRYGTAVFAVTTGKGPSWDDARSIRESRRRGRNTRRSQTSSLREASSSSVARLAAVMRTSHCSRSKLETRRTCVPFSSRTPGR